MNWDLSILFSDDTYAFAELRSIEEKAKRFEIIYKNKMKHLNSSEFLEALNAFEEISQSLDKVMTYAYLNFAIDLTKGSMYAKYQQECVKANQYLIFFDIEFNSLSSEKQNEFINSTSNHKHYLLEIKKYKKYQLSQKEEMILLKKEPMGQNAFARLFDELFNKIDFMFEDKKVSQEELLSLLYHPSRQVRKNATNSFTKSILPHQHLLGFILNMIKQNLAIDNELRGFKHQEDFRHFDNQITKKSVDSLIRACENSFDVVQTYYEKKAKILGLKQLFEYDRYAPIKNEATQYTYKEACNIVIEAFDKFSTSFGCIAKKAINENWVDVFPRENKQSGAFSHPATPDTHPFVLLNFTNQRRDVFTLAHEIGHAIHQYLSRSVGYLNSETPLTTAETASVFAEMLVFDYLLDIAENDEEKNAILANKIEDIFATSYRQINFTTFERAVHSHNGELDLDIINEYWIQESKKMFGSSVLLSEDYKIWWSYIPHFVHSPFYCYSYAYGQLLVLALYGLYKRSSCENFSKEYINFLTLGGSKSPSELISMFDLNIDDLSFWEIGINEIRRIVEMLKA